MMKSRQIAALRILFLLSVIQRVCRGINCYQCNSNFDENCSITNVNIKYLQPCPKDYGYCRKSNSIYYFTDSRDYVTIRECAMLRTDERECYRGRYSKDSFEHVCECKDSGCNRSVNLLAGAPVIVIVSQIVIQLFIRNCLCL